MIPIAIEVTPLCNAAQKNAAHAYFLNGVLYPESYLNLGTKKEVTINRNKKPHCYTLEKSFWDSTHSEPFKLSFNLKLFHSTISDKYTSLDKKIRDNLVIDLQHQISGYIARPGHVLL